MNATPAPPHPAPSPAPAPVADDRQRQFSAVFFEHRDGSALRPLGTCSFNRFLDLQTHIAKAEEQRRARTWRDPQPVFAEGEDILTIIDRAASSECGYRRGYHQAIAMAGEVIARELGNDHPLVRQFGRWQDQLSEWRFHKRGPAGSRYFPPDPPTKLPTNPDAESAAG
jgi:hypothetical protein